jgi:hypothetical protein
MTAAGVVAVPAMEPLLPPAMQRAGWEFGIYGVEFLPIGAGARASASFKVEEDHAFLITHAAALLTDNTDGVVTPQEFRCLVNLSRLHSNRANTAPMMTTGNDQPMEALFGTGSSPCAWPQPLVLGPNDSLLVQLTSLHVNPRNYRLSFLGARIFRARAADPFGFCRNGW